MNKVGLKGFTEKPHLTSSGHSTISSIAKLWWDESTHPPFLLQNDTKGQKQATVDAQHLLETGGPKTKTKARVGQVKGLSGSNAGVLKKSRLRSVPLYSLDFLQDELAAKVSKVLRKCSLCVQAWAERGESKWVSKPQAASKCVHEKQKRFKRRSKNRQNKGFTVCLPPRLEGREPDQLNRKLWKQTSFSTVHEVVAGPSRRRPQLRNRKREQASLTFSAAFSATRRTPVVDSATRLKANPGDSPPVRPA